MKRVVLSALLAMLLTACSSSDDKKIDSDLQEKQTSADKPFKVKEGLFYLSDTFYSECGLFDDENCVDVDEEVTLAPSYGYVDQTSGEVVLKIRGWIYESDANLASRFTFLSLLEGYIDASVTEPQDIERRVDPFLSTVQEDEILKIQIGQNYYEMKASSSSGNFSGEIRLSSAEAVDIINAQGGSDAISYRIILTKADSRVIEGEVALLSQGGTVVISDIDDTIKVSEVYVSKSRLLENTFYNKARVVNAMDTLFQGLSQNYNDISFHFVSGSPKQLQDTLVPFLNNSGFKIDSMYLRDFVLDVTAPELYDFFDENSTYKHKLHAITEIITDFPQSKFILVGDTGEKDPEVYSKIYGDFTEKIEAIYFQNVSDENSSNSRMTTAFGAYADKIIWLKPTP